MKIKFLYLCIFMVLLNSSCKTKDEIYWGEASANLNNSDWKPKIGAFTNSLKDGIDIKMDYYNSDGIITGGLFIYKLPPGIGKYKLSPTNTQVVDGKIGAEYYITDDDVLLASYKLDVQDTCSYVEVKSFNSKKQELRGTFEIKLLLETRYYPNPPDTMVLKQGSFHTKVLN